MDCVLMSGGVESSVILWEVSREKEVLPVYVRTGMAWEDVEVTHAREFVGSLDLNQELRVLKLPVEDIYGDHWSVTSKGVPGRMSEDSEVELPGRNILLLSKTAVLCRKEDVNAIHHGTLGSNPFPDASQEFFRLAEEMLSKGLDHRLEIRTPYRETSKSEVIRRAASNDLPIDLTFSCIDPVNGIHCGECNKCMERHREFVEAGVEDPSDYARGF